MTAVDTRHLHVQTAKDVVGKVIQELSRLDVLVNNASEQHVQHELTDITAEQLTQTFQTNVFGYFYFAQASAQRTTGAAGSCSLVLAPCAGSWQESFLPNEW